MKIEKKRLVSIVLTLSILGILILSGPAQALTLSLVRTDGSSDPTEGDEISFTGKIDLHTNDIIPIYTVDVLIDPTPLNSLSNAYVCSFYPNGTAVSGNPSICDIEIISITENYTNLGYGYGYGYGLALGNSSWDNFTWGYSESNYGYQGGYGYSTFSSNLVSTAEIIVTFNWTTPSVTSDTDYKIALGLNAKSSESDAVDFVSEDTVSVTVANTVSTGSSSSSSSTSAIITEVIGGVDKRVILDPTSTGIQEIILNLDKQLLSVTLDVEEVNIGQISIAAGDLVYKYLKIEIDDFAKEFTNYAKVRFKVPIRWLESEGVDKNDIALKRLVDGVWVDLDTEILSEDGRNIYFEAITPGFSYFAVGIRDPVVEVVTPGTGVEVQTPDGTVVMPDGTVCAQVLTYAIDPKNGDCLEYSTPCDVPENWKVVGKCKISTPAKSFRLSQKDISVILLTLLVVLFVFWMVYRAKEPRFRKHRGLR